MRAFIRYSPTADINVATHALVILERKQRKPIVDICPFGGIMVEDEEMLYLEFQKKRFFYDDDTGKFKRVKFDIERPLKTFNSTLEGWEKQMDVYGENRLMIPFPEFGKLLRQ